MVNLPAPRRQRGAPLISAHPSPLARHLSSHSVPITLADQIQTFLLNKEINGCTDATIRAYRFWLERLRAHVDDDIAALDYAAITQFIAMLRERDLAPSTIHQAYRCVKAFTRRLLATGVFDHNQWTKSV
jgi:site-specific recombinase XerD